MENRMEAQRSRIAAWQPETERAARAQEALLWALRPMEEGGSSMALEARSPAVSMDTTPLSQAQTARLLAAECYRLKSEARGLDVHHRILKELRDREKSLHILSRERLVNLSDTITDTAIHSSPSGGEPLRLPLTYRNLIEMALQ